MELAIALAALTISGLTGLFVYQKNPHSGTHVYFSLLVFFIGAYPVFNYLAVNSISNDQALLWAKAILFVSIPQGPLLYFFAKTYPQSSYIFNKRRQVIIVTWVLLNLILATAGLIFKEVAVSDGRVNIKPGPLVPSFGLLHVSSIAGGLVVLGSKYRHAYGMTKRQLAYIFYGILVSFSLTFLITFVLPVLLNNTILLAISPIFLTLSVLAVAYAIVSQKLFDIRSAATRSVAYALVLVTIAGIYSLAIFGITNTVFSGPDYETTRQFISVLLVIPLALSFQGLKSFFDRVSNKIFFQDAYDTQLFLDQLNQILVGTIELNSLLKESAKVMVSNFKSAFCAFVILEDSTTRPRVVTNEKILYEEHEIADYALATTHAKHSKVIADEIQSENEIKKALRKKDIAVIIALKSNDSGSKSRILGYLVLGHKQSGSPYNGQDIKVAEIISKELVIAIQNAMRFEEIQAFNVTLQQKVNEATKQLRRTNEKLKALDQSKDEFISMASHQLRTPLTSVKGYVSMVLDGDAGKLTKAQKDLLGQAFASSQRMVYLIADLLNVSRLRTGKFVIENKPTQLADVVETELEQLKEAAKTKQQELIYTKPKSFPVLMLDETKIRQVIMNFTDNALYYTQAGGRIEVRLEDKHDHIEFTVRDNGIGVPKAEQHHMFTKFYRAGNARKARPDGTGLGLFMAKKVVVSEGGAIIFNSTEGKGSIFGFTFPKAKLKAPAGSEKTDSSDAGL